MKKFSFVFFVMAFLFSTVTFADSSGGTAFCVETNYFPDTRKIGEYIDTTEPTEYAGKIYENMGYTTAVHIRPTRSGIKGRHANGVYSLESSILYFNGHGSYSKMQWNYKQKGGTYLVGIQRKSITEVDTSDDCEYIGLGNYDNTKNKLVIFAGCETGMGVNNLPSYVVDNGAETAIGWTTEINSEALKKWSERFNDKIGEGSTVQQAVNYANSFTYTDNRVKNCIIYGNKNLILTNQTRSISTNDERVKFVNKELDETLQKLFDKFLLNEEEKFVLEVNGIEDNIYDYILYIDNIRTDLGYTLICNKDKYVEKMYDNMNFEMERDIRKEIDRFLDVDRREESLFTNYIVNRVNQLSNNTENNFFYFSSDDGKMYYVEEYKVVTENGLKSIYSRKEEILYEVFKENVNCTSLDN